MQHLTEDAEIERMTQTVHPTPLPPFDMETYARDSESGVRRRPELDTSPPPVLHPASIPPMAGPPPLPERVPSSLQSQMTDCARRADLLATTLRVGAVSQEEAARILSTELDALEVSARGTSLGSLREMAQQLRAVVEELGGIGDEVIEAGREVIVLDSDPTSALLLALALESHGYFARTATSLADLSLSRGCGFEAIFVSADFPGADPSHPFSQMLREIVRDEAAPVVVYGRAAEPVLIEIAARGDANGALRIDVGIDELMPTVGVLLRRLAAA